MASRAGRFAPGVDSREKMVETGKIESLARRWLPPWAARTAKRATVRSRFRSQLEAARSGYRAHGDGYPVTTVFVAGLPKSGTTWLEKMLGCYLGFHEVMIPEVAAHEMRTGGSHDYDLPDDMFSRFGGALAVCKMHVHGSAHNVRLLHEAGLPYTVLFRDLRDVAVSNFFYVRNTPWHPEHPVYAGVDITEGLRLFATRTIGAYADWVRSWHERRDPQRSLELRYEQMLADPRGTLERVADLYRLPRDEATIASILEATSFRAMSGGRDSGQDNSGAFVRKGVAGDWKNHFDEPTKDLYKDEIGGFLIDFGYEKDTDW